MAKRKNPYKLKKNVRTKSLDPAFQPKVRKELLDMDYLHLLPEEEYIWYAQFVDEYYGASIKKNKNGDVSKGQLHTTKVLVKDCYDRNNKRNNDVFSIAKANNLLNSIDQSIDPQSGRTMPACVDKSTHSTNMNLYEDAMLEYLDKKEDDI